MSQLQQLRTTPPYDEAWKTATLVNLLANGRLNSVGSVTLTQNGTSTTLSDNHIRRGSKLFLAPTTANAVSVAGLWYDPASVPEAGGMITLNHSAVNQADLNFDYVVFA
ncbi:MAG TPA: hypothetical protein VF651_08395 [Gammaproteobacteria bacterium]